jgi:hypothetical protein
VYDSLCVQLRIALYYYIITRSVVAVLFMHAHMHCFLRTHTHTCTVSSYTAELRCMRLLSFIVHQFLKSVTASCSMQNCCACHSKLVLKSNLCTKQTLTSNMNKRTNMPTQCKQRQVVVMNIAKLFDAIYYVIKCELAACMINNSTLTAL